MVKKIWKILANIVGNVVIIGSISAAILALYLLITDKWHKLRD